MRQQMDISRNTKRNFTETLPGYHARKAPLPLPSNILALGGAAEQRMTKVGARLPETDCAGYFHTMTDENERELQSFIDRRIRRDLQPHYSAFVAAYQVAWRAAVEWCRSQPEIKHEPQIQSNHADR